MANVGGSRSKSPQASVTEMVQVVLPNDTNPLGNVLGGRVMHWIDMAGAVVAFRHSRRPVVTASMERLDFHSPIRVGHIVQLIGKLVFVGRTSMQVGVEVYAEDPISGSRTHTGSAFLTYVALDQKGNPVSIPKLKLTTKKEKQQFELAAKRRLSHIEQKKVLK